MCFISFSFIFTYKITYCRILTYLLGPLWGSALKDNKPTQKKKKKGKSKALGEPLGAPHKKNRHSGKGKGKACAHEIVSSALIPHDITKHLQESHHVAVEPPAPAP